MNYVTKQGECCEIMNEFVKSLIITIGGSLTAKVSEARGRCPFCGEMIDVEWEEEE